MNTTTDSASFDKSRVVLLIVDMIGDFKFFGAENLIDPARKAAQNIAILKKKAFLAQIPVIYVNDNYGNWRSDLRALVQISLGEGSNGAEIVRILKPTIRDYFILKPKYSAFYYSPLELLLNQIEANTIVITGVATDACIFLTAADAYVRGFRVIIPDDCVAAKTDEDSQTALKKMQEVFKAEITDSKKLDFELYK